MTGRVFFTSDTHFGHRALIEKGWRAGFSSVEEHDEVLIQNWNDTVRPEDQVWHEGDFAMGFGAARRVRELVSRLNGQIHLIAGNHDAVWPGHRMAHKQQRDWLDCGFASIQAFARRKIGGQQVLLSHFPYVGDHSDEDRYAGYRLHDTGLWLLHGHVHTEWVVRGRQLNVGVDAWGMRPVSLEEVVEVLADREEPALSRPES